jgi:hypothetical protein
MCVVPFCIQRSHEVTHSATGPPPGPQLCLCPHLRSHDLERPRVDHKYRVADCRRAQVREPFSLPSGRSLICARRHSHFVHTSLSGSMEPAFYRGDLLFLVNPANKRYETGDITVYRIPGQDIPIVHRVLETHDVVKTVNGFVFVLPSNAAQKREPHFYSQGSRVHPSARKPVTPHQGRQQLPRRRRIVPGSRLVGAQAHNWQSSRVRHCSCHET